MPTLAIVPRHSNDPNDEKTGHWCLVNADADARCHRCRYVEPDETTARRKGWKPSQTLRPGDRCKRTTCRESEYCWTHLRKMYRVRIAPSRIVGAGLGLFAGTDRPLEAKIDLPRDGWSDLLPFLKRRLLRRRRGRVVGLNTSYRVRLFGGRTQSMTLRELRDRFLIFRKGEIIGPLTGETLSPAEFDRRYANNWTAPYAIGVGKKDKKTKQYDRYLDALCSRNFASYANDARGEEKKEEEEGNDDDEEEEEKEDGNNARFTGRHRLQAKRTIWAGEEILWSYGQSYWKGEMAPIAQRTVSRKRALRG